MYGDGRGVRKGAVGSGSVAMDLSVNKQVSAGGPWSGGVRHHTKVTESERTARLPYLHVLPPLARPLALLQLIPKELELGQPQDVLRHNEVEGPDQAQSVRVCA